MKISTSQFRNGLKIIINDQPCSILEHEFHKPGKGQAVMRVKFRNLITGKVIDKTYKSGESVEEADVMTVEMSYLYSCLLYTSPSPRDKRQSRMPSSA